MSKLHKFLGTLNTTRLWLLLWLVPYLGFGVLGQAGHVHQLPHLGAKHHQPQIQLHHGELSPFGDAECLVCQWMSDAAGWLPPAITPNPQFSEAPFAYATHSESAGSSNTPIESARAPPSFQL